MDMVAEVPIGEELILRAKRKCLLCFGRKNLREGNEKEEVLALLKELIEHYNNLYNTLRAKNAKAEDIKKALELKRHCMDLAEKCSACDREVDFVNRAFPHRI